MMALEAVVAVLVAEWVKVSLRYREMAAYRSKVEGTYRSYERRYLTIGSEGDCAREGAAQNRAVAGRRARLKGAYVQAS